MFSFTAFLWAVAQFAVRPATAADPPIYSDLMTDDTYWNLSTNARCGWPIERHNGKCYDNVDCLLCQGKVFIDVDHASYPTPVGNFTADTTIDFGGDQYQDWSFSIDLNFTGFMGYREWCADLCQEYNYPNLEFSYKCPSTEAAFTYADNIHAATLPMGHVHSVGLPVGCNGVTSVSIRIKGERFGHLTFAGMANFQLYGDVYVPPSNAPSASPSASPIEAPTFAPTFAPTDSCDTCEKACSKERNLCNKNHGDDCKCEFRHCVADCDEVCCQ